MDNYFADNADIQWHFRHLGHEDVSASLEDDYAQAVQHDDAPRSYDDAVESYRTVLDLAGRIAATEIAPRAADVDCEGAQLDRGKVSYARGTQRSLDVLASAGLMGFTLPRRYGGLNFPGLVYSMAVEMVSQADASLMNLFGLQEIGETLCEYGTDAQREKYLPLFASGKASGAMVLTEPDAGSDLQSVRLKAVPQADGSWRLYGVKRFITNGCADISLVLARSEEGSVDGRGLSMYVCEPCPELVIRRIEHKLGIHGSPTCELQYNGVPAQLVGQRRFGLIRYVMSLMNGARLGIACQSIGIGQAAYDEALSYARHRVQFKHPIVQFPQVYEMLARMKSRIQIARAITYEASRVVDQRRMVESKVDAGASALKGRLKELTTYASMLTPLAKAYASEMANQVTYDAIQVHGGTGYMREFSVERLARDARITSIYEGTTQLQVVAAMPGITSGAMGTYLSSLGERPFRPGLARLVSAAREARERLAFCVLHVKSINDRTYTELVSRRMVDMVCDCLGVHLVLLQAEKDPERTVMASKIIADLMPRIRMEADSVSSGDRLLMEQTEKLL